MEKCGCWAVLRRGVKGACKSSSGRESANSIPRTSLVYDAATETRYLNASNREFCAPNEAQLTSSDNPNLQPLEDKPVCQLLQFTFQELKSATGNFRPDSILGEGGFGYVFKGWIEENGTAPAKPGTGITVAVKSLKPDGLQGHREWVAEVDFLGQLHHPNLVKLIGYCIEDDQRLLVYEFMTRGSLENHLFRRLRLHLVQLKGWPSSMEVPSLSFTEILRHQIFCLIQIIIQSFQILDLQKLGLKGTRHTFLPG